MALVAGASHGEAQHSSESGQFTYSSPCLCAAVTAPLPVSPPQPSKFRPRADRCSRIIVSKLLGTQCGHYRARVKAGAAILNRRQVGSASTFSRSSRSYGVRLMPGRDQVPARENAILSLMPKFTPEIIQAAIDGFEQQKVRIDAQIGELRAMLPGGSTENATTPEAQSRRRKVSAAARRRMAVGQRRRWAAVRGEAESPASARPKTSKPKRKLSAAGRAAIVAALKKRWAAKRAEAASPKAPVKKKAVTNKAAKRASAKKAAAKRTAAKVAATAATPAAQ